MTSLNGAASCLRLPLSRSSRNIALNSGRVSRCRSAWGETAAYTYSAGDATGRIDWTSRLAPTRSGLPPYFSSGATRRPSSIAPPLIASGPCVGATPPSTAAATTRSGSAAAQARRVRAAAGQADDGHLVDSRACRR